MNKMIALSLIMVLSFNSASFAMNDDIHQAAQRGDVDAVRQFLQAGVPVDDRDPLQKTPLHWAAENGHKSVAHLLLQYRANVDAPGEGLRRQLLWAAHNGGIALFGFQHGAAVAAQGVMADDLRKTPLIYAVSGGHVHVARLLLERGASTPNLAELHFWAGNSPHQGDQKAFRFVSNWIEYKESGKRPLSTEAALAFACGKHPRSGAGSQVRFLDESTMRSILNMASDPTLDEIHQIAKKVRRRRNTICLLMVPVVVTLAYLLFKG